MRLDTDNIRLYADTLVRQTAAGGIALDYTAASLAVLEALIEGSAERLSLDAASETERNLTIFYAGCYLGETLAAESGGRWEFAQEWWESVVAVNRVRLNPFELVRRRIDEGRESVSLTRLQEAWSLAGGDETTGDPVHPKR
ncbi:MAG: hypothetical protein ACKO5K_14795 [Armatimonadota bacterium]